MSDISNIYSKVGATYSQPKVAKVKDDKAEIKENTSNKKIPGKTVGDVKLSDKAQKYYEELRSKFHNMEFVLVSEDQKENAKARAASFAQHGKMVVLIDEAKIERMAEDSSYRAQYEGLIEKSAASFASFAESVAATGANVKGYGMQVNDNGTTSFFAVLEKSSEAQAKRIAEKREEKRAEKKAEDKKAAKERLEERVEEARESNKANKVKLESNKNKPEETVITANSLEELLQKIQDHVQLEKSDSVITDAEKTLGQNIDFSA
ncbi:MAG: DUF6033 family protein [Lachnospiraceae bacterium]|nr:DUF6033 family protein [Lachnospiraceae bacterium]